MPVARCRLQHGTQSVTRFVDAVLECNDRSAAGAEPAEKVFGWRFPQITGTAHIVQNDRTVRHNTEIHGSLLSRPAYLISDPQQVSDGRKAGDRPRYIQLLPIGMLNKTRREKLLVVRDLLSIG